MAFWVLVLNLGSQALADRLSTAEFAGHAGAPLGSPLWRRYEGTTRTSTTPIFTLLTIFTLAKMNLGPPEDNNPRKKKEGRLTFTQLIQEAGLRDENWKRKEGVSGELYETSLVGLHEQIYEAFKNHYVRMFTDL